MHSISDARTSFTCGSCPLSDCRDALAAESRSGTDSRPDVAVLPGAHTRPAAAAAPRPDADDQPSVAPRLSAHWRPCAEAAPAAAPRLDADARPAVARRPAVAAVYRPDLFVLCPDCGRPVRDQIPSRVRPSDPAVAADRARQRVCRAYRHCGGIPLPARPPV